MLQQAADPAVAARAMPTVFAATAKAAERTAAAVLVFMSFHVMSIHFRSYLDMSILKIYRDRIGIQDISR